MKRYLFCTAIAAMALTSCSSDDFLGDVPGNNPSAVTAKEISFSGEAGKTSRAGETTGADAAKALNNKFVVFGTKTSNSTATTVYDHYNVEYKTSAWEYKGLDFNSLNEKSKTAGETKQSLKYWDYSANQYDFVAFSFGNATQGEGDNNVTARRVNSTDYTYTLTGKIDDLVKCYIADRVTVAKDGFNKKVSFTFHPLGTKVNIGLYEVIEGYSVKDVKFYSSATDTNPTETPTLFASSATIPTGTEKEVITVSFDGNKNVKTEWQAATSTTSPARPLVTRGDEASVATNKSTTITFDNLSKVGAEGLEGSSNDYLGRDKNTGSISKPTNPKAILPCGKVGALTLKVDYTLISTDGSGETIKVTGATAKIAEDYTNWTANKSFTYIFKISQNTNGSTGDGSPTGLYPIEFDSVIATEGTGGNPEDIELNSNN